MGSLYGVQRYVFIVGHMRSYSTLLSHLLGSHPQVRGYAEQHLSYDSLGSLKTLRRRLEREAFTGKRAESGYLLDKLLHNELRLAAFVTDSPKVKRLFLLREPTATLRSIVAHIEGSTEAVALAYYVGRLAAMRAMAEHIPAGSVASLYLDADRLLDDSEAVLATLTAFLGLDEALVGRYDLFALSGQRGAGDSSARLGSRYIVRERHSHDVELSASTVEQARRAYEDCRGLLLQRMPA